MTSSNIKGIEADFASLARIALAGRSQDIQLLLHRVVRRYRASSPELAAALTSLLHEAPTRASPLRRQAEAPLPVDADSRFQLLRVESDVSLDQPPLLDVGIYAKLAQVIAERAKPELLVNAGLTPTKTILFTGPPGVGKTMSARWIAQELGRPLLTLDLAAVMSSYLGRTGGNLRYVLDYAKSTNSVLLLDEIDAIAKRRDDKGEVGELKRLVTVLLQEIDDWPSSGVLIGATNHANLLDPAIWRRFDLVVEYGLPTREQVRKFTSSILDGKTAKADQWAGVFGIMFAGSSYSEIERTITSTRRRSVISGVDFDECLEALIEPGEISKADLRALAAQLYESRLMSQRQVQELTGVARETIRAHAAKKSVVKEAAQ
ncbi:MULTISPECIES: AAA family ATPase [Roseomonadaceae]|uniref:AAA family ATPase n=1 Tax=Falsiroseomonas oleicola TaxID=2801474 RepID=A0ABS6HCA8_9PROT|nr:ATP-binding protein [Roseomonas oleicola]MBU8546361.1 AAA family ATPase [Roseomonas oleicola]